MNNNKTNSTSTYSCLKYITVIQDKEKSVGNLKSFWPKLYFNYNIRQWHEHSVTSFITICMKSLC